MATLGRLLGRRGKYILQNPQDTSPPLTSKQSLNQTGWVNVRTVRLARDDGILYPHDRLGDVADDKEQMIAEFEERPSFYSSPHQHHNHGDGTSASSAGTESPDVCRSPEIIPTDVDSAKIAGVNGNFLQVRRGSEPALNQLDLLDNCSNANKRWSTAVIGAKGDVSSDEDEEVASHMGRGSPEERGEGSGEERYLNQPTFSRNAARLSMLSPELFQHWEEERCRREPLGGTGSPPITEDHPSTTESSQPGEYQVLLRNEAEPLGIHVIPEYDPSGRDMGLIIQGIESGGRIHRDGRLSVGDRIVAVNGHSLCNVTFAQAQQIFRDALSQQQQVCLRLLRGNGQTDKPPPPPVYPKPKSVAMESSDHSTDSIQGEESGERSTTPSSLGGRQPRRKLGPATSLMTSNTRRLGRKMAIELTKASPPHGLGFSLTTRDNPAGAGPAPVYVKHILPMGAAIEDGRLRAGDRLLEVNGREVRSQSEAVSLLRSVPSGGKVRLLISRQDTSASPSLPRQLPPNEVGEDPTTGRCREVLTFEIPLNDTGSAGLGVSVKGKSVMTPSNVNDETGNGGELTDLGIFVKSVIHGGAASKDGRLRPNDQLVNINGISLLHMSNGEAMETLRRAMTRGEGPNPHAILLSVARRVPTPTGHLSEDNDTAEGDAFNETYHLNGDLHLIHDSSPKMASHSDCHNGPAQPKQNSREEDETDDSGFSRDGFGRQSMSEKRHAHLDAKSTDTYQKMRRAKELRLQQQEEQHQDHLKQNQERTAEESSHLPSKIPPTESTESRPQPPPRRLVRRSSSLESIVDRRTEPIPPIATPGHKRKGGLLRGLGSMFRFGKGKKSLNLPPVSKTQPAPSSNEFKTTFSPNITNGTDTSGRKKGASESRVRPGGSLSRPPPGWNSPENRRQPLPCSTFSPPLLRRPELPHSTLSDDQLPPPPRTRSLRHCRQSPSPASNSESNSSSHHSRSRSFDIYKEVEKAGSRAPIADPNFFQHYMARCKVVERPTSNFFEYENMKPPLPAPQGSNHVRSYSHKYQRNRPIPLSIHHPNAQMNCYRPPTIVASSKV